MHNQRAEILGVGQRVAHDLGVGDAGFAVGEGDGARLAEQPDLGHLLAEQALGRGGHGVHVDERRVAGASQDEIDERDIVDDGIGIGHAGDRGDAARRRGAARCRERLAMLVSGFAGRDHHVDEARRKDETRAIDTFGIAGGVCVDIRPKIGDEAVADENTAALVETRGGIDQPRIDERQGFGAGVLFPVAHRRRLTGWADGGRAPGAPPCARPRPSPPARE
jgi:hypothetical protein